MRLAPAPSAGLRAVRPEPFVRLVGVGGIGSGIVMALEGDRTLGRDESRGARLLDARDRCKLHIVAHHVARLLAADPSGRPFHVVPVGRVGDDQAGRALVAEMRSAGMDTSRVEAVPGRPTLFSVCFQYPDGAGGNLTTVDSAASALGRSEVDAVAPLVEEAGPRGIVLAAPEVPLAVRRRLLELGTQVGAFRVASFLTAEVREAQGSGLLEMVDLLAMNREEAAVLAGPLDPHDPEPFLGRVAGALDGERGGMRIVVSAGALGAFGFEEGCWVHRPAPSVEVAGTAGAGDALLGGIVAALAVGIPLLAPTAGVDPPAKLADALDLGVLLAACAVTSPHTIPPDADLRSVLAFAEALGLSPRPPLAACLHE
ncbi:MAG TPA: carbohydrate kinase family protein [Actinomycetota bacterium]|nr:carbohydrate kinase family protein [Actinomycetota bacterium]